MPEKETCFYMLARSLQGAQLARLLIDSLRAFGGRLSDYPVWVFSPTPEKISAELSGLAGVDLLPLDVDETYQGFYFVEKVLAGARAEQLASTGVRSLVWLSLDCFIIQPPELFDLTPPYAAAFRPVHIRNVGSLSSQPLDEFWSAIYQYLGLEEAPFTVESFVDMQLLRPYFNTHLFAIDPSQGILGAWKRTFQAMVSDAAFMLGPCRDELHQIFLHQAILSTLVAKQLDTSLIRILPPEYSYPLNFQEQIPASRRTQSLENLVCFVREDVPLHPDRIAGIPVREPLRSWLVARMSG